MRKTISLLLAFVLLFSLIPAISAEPEAETLLWKNVYTTADADSADYRAMIQTIDGVNYLFLPAGIVPNAVPMYFELNMENAVFSIRGALGASGAENGKPVDLISLCGEGDTYTVTLLAKCASLSAELALTVVPTGDVASMFLVSDDPVDHGREWVEASPDKSNKATGSMMLATAEGTVVYQGKLTQIKGRGNSTWLKEKKPYQIKLDKKTDLLETGKNENRAKTWVLLANDVDTSLLRNRIVYDLSVAMQMQPGIECRPVNLYYDGEYRGVYLLCEKVEIGSGRVDIADLESANEDANPSVSDFDTLEVKTGATANGVSYVYCDAMQSPEDYTGGYLLEMDTAVRAQAEKCYFVTARGQYVVVKEPEYCSKQEMDYIGSYYQEFEDAVFNKGVNPNNQKDISAYVSVDSLAQCYIINELTKNPDGYRTSSFLYKDADSDIMTMGPIWDYDLSFGYGWGDFVDACAEPEEFFTLYSNFGAALYRIPCFRQAVHDIYLNTVSPLVTETLLSGSVKNDDPLHSIAAYRREIEKSAYANGIVWHINKSRWSSNLNAVKSYITTREQWLRSQYAAWDADSFSPLTGFIDVHEDDWYFESVAAAADYGIMNGMNNGIFSPLGNATRAQGTKVLFEMAGGSRVAYSPVFSDVNNHDWFAPAVMWAHKDNIVKGYDDGTFRPEDHITRQDMVVLLYRYLGSPMVNGSELSSFIDGNTVADYAKDAVEWAIENSILNGYTDHTLQPYSNITRAELAALMVRCYEQFVLKTEE